MRNNKIYTFGFIFLVFALCAFFGNYAIVNEYDVEVTNVELVSDTHGTDGDTTTRFSYLVFTDKGTFEIAIDGFFNSVESYNKIKNCGKYHIKTRGFNAPFFGIYPNIVEVK